MAKYTMHSMKKSFWNICLLTGAFLAGFLLGRSQEIQLDLFSKELTFPRNVRLADGSQAEIIGRCSLKWLRFETQLGYQSQQTMVETLRGVLKSNLLAIEYLDHFSKVNQKKLHERLGFLDAVKVQMHESSPDLFAYRQRHGDKVEEGYLFWSKKSVWEVVPLVEGSFQNGVRVLDQSRR